MTCIPSSWKEQLMDEIYSNLRQKLRNLDKKLNRKLKNLINKSPWSTNPCNDAVKNLSSLTLDETTTTALGYGLNFHINRRPSSVAISKAFRVLESQGDISDSNLNIAKGMVYKDMLSTPLIKNNMPRRYIKSLANLKKNKNISITKADKSNSLVILDKPNYIEKMQVLLNDTSTYKKLSKNPLDSVIKTFNKEMKCTTLLMIYGS